MKQTLLSILMMLLPLMANAETVEIDGIYYKLITKGKVAEVTNNPNKYIGEVNIPQCVTYENIEYNVTMIGNFVFNNNNNVTSVTIPNSVTSIGESAFQNCSLTSLSIPNSVAIIGKNAFRGCQALTSVTIGNNVTSIGDDAFRDCVSLTSVTIPNSVTSLGYRAFYDCRALTSVTISENITIIKSATFYRCRNLTSVIIPNNVTIIEDSEYNPDHYGYDGTFAGCLKLTSVIIGNNVTRIGNEAFSSCKALSSVTIPNSVTNIGRGAFQNCYSLTSVTIPNSVLGISSKAFENCDGLNSVHISDINAWCNISLGGKEANPLYYARHLFLNGKEVKDLIIPNDVTNINYCMFYNCSSLTSVTIPNSVTSIGMFAFDGCSGLTSITIPNSVTAIGEWAFNGCSGLTSVTIGSGVNQINRQAFANCLELMDVYCYAEDVPSTSTDAFDYSYIEHATLHVPSAALNAYSNTAPWSNFKNKVAIGEGEQLYTLTYMLDGIKYVECNVREGETITPEPAPKKNGYTFSGWSEIPETMPAHDVTITGSFTANKYNLIYKVDDADYKTYEVEYGATITPEPSPTKVGYNFAGWSEIPETMPDHDVTVSGIFIPKTYLPGDANGDGQITVTDIGVIVDIILGKTPANARKQQEAEPQ